MRNASVGCHTRFAPKLAWAQFYNLDVSDQVPYRVGGTIQDQGTAAGPSNSLRSEGIVLSDWSGAGGGEAGDFVFDRKHPGRVYAGEYGGIMTRFESASGNERNVSYYPTNPSGHGAEDLRVRFQWTAPLLASKKEPGTIFHAANVLLKSTDGGQSWQELPGLRGHGSGSSWQPGAGGMCLHTILLDPAGRGRMFADISSAGAFRSDDAGRSWRPINRGLRSEQIPDPTAEVGHCVHRLALHPSRPDVLFMQKHWDVMRRDDAGESWREVSGNLPSDFGFPIEVHAHEPDTIYVVPIKSDSEHFPPDGRLRVYRSRTGGGEWEALTKGLPQRDCYVNVLRDAMAVDALDPCGVYFGTTGGQVYASADAGDGWAPLVRDLPPVLA